MHERKPWTPQEDDLIKKSVRQNTDLKWRKILTWIKNVDQSFSRTSKQLRERWKFHLDPNLSKQSWTQQQEEILFKSHMLKGSKWKQIQKLLPRRSQKCIRNYFYMTLRKSLRRVTKILGAKNSTNQSKELKPSIITKLVESANESPEKRQSIYRLFNLHKMKSGDCRKVKLSTDDLVVFRQLIDDMLRYNQLYNVNKKQGLVALEQKLSHLKNENCIHDKTGQKSTILTSTTFNSGADHPQSENQEQFEEIEEQEIIQEDQDYSFMVIGQNMIQSLIFQP